ncbi:hypothetical protein HDU97_000938 [Phlyctochytrium planicorne]|nr:hypothetical protein HDU97_000938 [Phlyctochytrium planicorne]
MHFSIALLLITSTITTIQAQSWPNHNLHPRQTTRNITVFGVSCPATSILTKCLNKANDILNSLPSTCKTDTDPTTFTDSSTFPACACPFIVAEATCVEYECPDAWDVIYDAAPDCLEDDEDPATTTVNTFSPKSRTVSLVDPAFPTSTASPSVPLSSPEATPDVQSIDLKIKPSSSDRTRPVVETVFWMSLVGAVAVLF